MGAEGATGWGYDDVLPYFRKNESWEGPSDFEYQGEDGELTVVRSPERDLLLDAWIESAEAAGYAYVETTTRVSRKASRGPSSPFAMESAVVPLPHS